jgi:transcriptional regulator with XRE-family HTH domain
MITGEMVLADRTARHLSRRAYAELVGLTPTAINNLEHGRKMRAEEEEKLAQFISDDGVIEVGEQGPELVTTSTEARTIVNGIEDDVELWSPDDEEDEEDELVVEVGEAPPDPNQPGVGGQPVPVTITLPEGRLISNGELATYKRCKRKWWLGWYRHLVLKRERPEGARAIGSWCHAALERKYVPHGEVSEDPRDALERVLTDVYTRFVSMTEDPEELDRFKKDADLARAMIEGYVQWLAETGADEGLVVIAPEQILWAPLDDVVYPEPVFIIGKLDVRVHRASDGARLFIEHKTVPDLTSPIKTIHQKPQPLHYMLLERAQGDGDEHVAGVLYNMLRKVRRTERAQPPFYQRVEVRHNDHELQSHKLHTRATAIDMLRTEQDLRTHDRPTAPSDLTHLLAPPTPMDDCAWSCDYFPVCSLFDDGSRAEDMLAQYYEVTEHLSYYFESYTEEKEPE